VYNERATFQQSIDAVLAKELDGVDKEIIIVESNSTDGTAELVRAYAGRAGVRLIVQDRPRGKGNAVREGLKAASGSVVLIQDADREYDVEDYDALLEPLLADQAIFVLGTRHSGEWKLRQFSGQPLVSLFFNLGHVFYTWVLNALLRERMTDPFTMYKVFRRDALYGLEFVCNRFDFDHELVIKLVRKGYRPSEIAVNYVSRSFRDGKKVSVIRDGLTWLWTDFRLRLGPIGPRTH
jgi:glycosyltransferase involved in cell wall biosynthesis